MQKSKLNQTKERLRAMKVSLEEQTKDFKFEVIRLTGLKTGDWACVNGDSYKRKIILIQFFSVKNELFAEDTWCVTATGPLRKLDGTPSKNWGEHTVCVNIQTGEVV